MRILHLLDASADWEQRVAVGQMLDRLTPDRCAQFSATIDAQGTHADWFPSHTVAHMPTRFNLAWTAAPAIRRLIERHNIDVVQAWGTHAALAAVSARPPNCVVALHRFDPIVDVKESKALRTLSEAARTAIVCSAITVQRHVVEGGVPLEKTALVRPGVDFRCINDAQKDASSRTRMGLSPGEKYTLIDHAHARSNGLHRAVWASHTQHYVDRSHKTVVYGLFRTGNMLRRQVRQLPPGTSTLWPGTEIPYETLVANAHCLLIAPTSDVSTTGIAWAMAANVPIVGTAVYAVAEFVAHRQNGYLVKPDASRRMSVTLAAALRQTTDMKKETETARGQAFEVFSVRRFVDQQIQVYENLAGGVCPSDDLADPALV